MRRRAVLAFLALSAAVAAGSPAPPAPDRWVTDAPGILTPGTRSRLDARLEAYERQTGHQVLVWIYGSTGGEPLEDFTVRAFAAWHVGRKALDDGLVLFIFASDRRIRIEVGYGLEGVVPDAVASRIIREAIEPRIQAGDNDGAVLSGTEALLAAIEGRAAAPGTGPPASRGPLAAAPRHRPGSSLLYNVLLGIGAFLFLVLLVTHPSLALYLLVDLLSESGRSSGGRDGGDFSGGGGRSGGGGASGGW